jgi:DNA-binding XRE family transcriptional regulator
LKIGSWVRPGSYFLNKKNKMAYSAKQKKESQELIGILSTSQKTLAELLGVSEAQIILLKKGEAGLKPKHMEILKKHFHSAFKTLFLDEKGVLSI